MYISVDVGGTNIRVVGSASLDEVSFSGPVEHGKITQNFEDEIGVIVAAARRCAHNAKIEAVGICVPGTLHSDKASLAFAPNLAWWKGKPFVIMLANALGCTVYAEHDTVAAGLGEVYYGSSPDEFCYLVWGTGIGGAKVHKTAYGQVGTEEIDWQRAFSAWERDCGGKALSDFYGKPSESFSDELWGEIKQKFKAHLEEFVTQTGVRNIIFGGGVALRHQEFLESMSIDGVDSICATQFGAEAGLCGGFALIRQRLGHV